MGINLPVKNINLAVRHDLAQMVKGTAIAQTDFKHDTIMILDHIGRGIQAVTLGLQATNNTVKAGHSFLRSGLGGSTGGGIRIRIGAGARRHFTCVVTYVVKHHARRRILPVMIDPGAPIAFMKFKAVAVRVQKIDRRPFAAVGFPFPGTGILQFLAHRGKVGRINIKGKMGIAGGGRRTLGIKAKT